MKTKLFNLREHPENNRIYESHCLEDLKTSLNIHGQMEPLAVTQSGLIISGHRRYNAMNSLGWSECDVRIVEPENELIALIEHNRYRQKSASDILKEARILEKELRKKIGRGRYASKNREGRYQGERITMVVQLSKKLGVGTSRLKQLFSISNYKPELIEEIDNGSLSVSAAYAKIKEEFFNKDRDKIPQNTKYKELSKCLKVTNLSIVEIENIIRRTYPYCLEKTNISPEKRGRLLDQLSFLSELSNDELLAIRKKDEVENTYLEPKYLERLDEVTPSLVELNNFFSDGEAIDKVCLDLINEDYFNQKFWNTIRTHVHSLDNNNQIGRRLSAFVGFYNCNGYRLLGIISYGSPSYALKARDAHIGWTTDLRKEKRDFLVNLSVCCPTQPFGFNFLGGKFLAYFADSLIPLWEKKYNQRVIAVTCTSLEDGLCQYSGLKNWKRLGSSSGRMLLKPLRQEWQFWRSWYRENYRDLYDKTIKDSSPTQSALREIFNILDIPSKEFIHNHRRGIHIHHLYKNYIEFLNGTIKEEHLVAENLDWRFLWYEKMKGRKVVKGDNSGTASNTLGCNKQNEEVMLAWLNVKGAL